MIKIVSQYALALVVSMVCLKKSFSQKGANREIDNALKENKIDKAEQILNQLTAQFIAEKNADSLVEYIFYTGAIAKAKSNTKEALKKVDSYFEKVKMLTSNAGTLRQACIENGEFYGSLGMNAAAYQSNVDALTFTLRMPLKTGNQLAMVENNLAAYAQRMGDVNLSMQHGKKALEYLSKEKNPDFETYYIACNAMGTIFYYNSKLDSAQLFFLKALDALKKTERTPRNQYFRPAIINNNLAGIYQLNGKTTLAIEAMKATIDDVREFLAANEPDNKKVTALTFQFEATDNLAGIYKDLGDYAKAQYLLEYSYEQKQRYLNEDDPAIFISQILLGQLYFATRNYDKALTFLNSGREKIALSDGDYLFWQADACNTLALLFERKSDIKKATLFYEKADSLYEASLQGEYDNIYLEFLSNAALFFAENNQPVIAENKAMKGYDYIVKTQGGQSLQAFQQLIVLSKAYYALGNYRKSLDYSKKSLQVVNYIISGSVNLLDSIKTEMKKPAAILQKAKASYALLKVKDESSLSSILNELNQALAIIERQKIILSDAKDINLLLAENSDLTAFIEKIILELYNTSHKSNYLDELVSFHESGLYNRIRSRLDKNDSLQFSKLPPDILRSEKKLKAAMSTALDGSGTHDEKMNRYFAAVKNWISFREKIKEAYPTYYKMRYASIFKEADRMDDYLPANATLIRYFFVDKRLYAFVSDNGKKTLVALNTDSLTEKIAALSGFETGLVTTSSILFNLYRQLWAPLAPEVHHQKIIIVPDGILYNLNFELLTPSPINDFKELATKSLLARYTFSYNYSLLLLHQPANNLSARNNFIAFAPGFSDEIKNDYRGAIKDSFKIDKSYLFLLPQPFSISLVEKMRRLFKGNAYTNENSTESAFRKNAGNHKIIHIGSHAVSNNDHPQFSRLIFAKDISDVHKENALYVDDIYSCDLTSNLTVLTACESGKPGYQDGEGMISLAHAFNFAGSESIITGLWKIDEEASALLIENFYRQLLKGLSKDEALRQAKLEYIKNTDGRMIAPQYWAGLVIMGDTSPIDIAPGYFNYRVVAGLALIILILTSVYLKSKKKK